MCIDAWICCGRERAVVTFILQDGRMAIIDFRPNSISMCKSFPFPLSGLLRTSVGLNHLLGPSDYMGNVRGIRPTVTQLTLKPFGIFIVI